MDEDTREKLVNFFSQFPNTTFKRGSVLISFDEEKARNIFFIKSGYVRQSVLSFEGEEFVVNILKPGAYFPIVMVMGEVRNHYAFDALTTVQAFRAPTEKVVEFLKDNPDVLQELVMRLSRGMHAMVQKFEHVVFCDSLQRVIFALYNCMAYCGEPYGKGDGVRIAVPLTHKDLANMVGLSRETVSRKLEQMLKTGLIEKKKRHYYIKSRAEYRKKLCIDMGKAPANMFSS